MRRHPLATGALLSIAAAAALSARSPTVVIGDPVAAAPRPRPTPPPPAPKTPAQQLAERDRILRAAQKRARQAARQAKGMQAP